ncbi:MAG TPA: C25 family peptidase propeptide domain-containing protein, partial [Candidatus Rifleibacterium sp.]|nr:C25 family peptidase propeptide domain-containing protein [Candidatus Rifleibacterium sp.]
MKKFFVFFVMMVMLTGVVFAGELELKDAKGSGLKVLSHKMGGQGEMTMRMSCSLDKLYFYDAETPKGSFTVMYSPEFFFGGEYGAPQLPVITKLIQIPFGANFRIEVKSYDTQEYNLADYGVSTRIFPRQPSAPKDGSEVPFIYEQSAYVFKGFHGQQLTCIKDIGVMRHMRLAHLTIAPVKYSPIDNKIIVYNNIEFEVVMENADMTKTRDEHNNLWSPAFSWMESLVVVPEALRFGERNAVQSYLIVADPAFKDA